jgi:exodeoxyribonuclease-3
VAWKEHIHCSAGERKALSDLVSFGLIDTHRMHDHSAGVFSWWDYRELSFAKNKGLRIDLIYATPPAASRCRSVRVDRDERRGDKPSDHAPVIATFDF